MSKSEVYEKAANAITHADFLFIGAGAGMSADAGIPVFANVAKDEVYQKMGVGYDTLSSPDMLAKNPHLFYGFWYESLQKYSNGTPHQGYSILLDWKQFFNNIENSKIIKKKLYNQME